MSTNEQCKVPTDNCSRGGTGPTCSQNPEIGGANKRECLEEAKKNCEEALKKCIEECDDAKEKFIQDTTGGQSSLIQGVYTDEGVQGSSGNSYETKASFALANVYGYGDSSYFRGPSDVGGQDWHSILWTHARCMQDCYYQAISDCETVQCYCSSLKCEVDGRDLGGAGGGGGGTPFDYVYKTDQLGEVDFDTVSAYGGLIELVYTRAYLPGNVIWVSDVYSKRSEEIYTTTDSDTHTITVRTAISISNKIDMHIGLSAGVLEDVLSVRVNGNVYYDRNDPAYSDIGETLELMTGSEGQRVRQVVAEEFGFGRVPAYRGLAYLVLSDFQLNGLTQFPKFSIEVAKSVTRYTDSAESATIAGKDSSIIWTVIPEAHRAFAESSNGVMCVDTDDLTVRWDEPVGYAIEVTPLGKVMTYDGSTISVFDPSYGESFGGYPASLPVSQSFMFRTPDMTGNSSLSLFTQDGAGNTVAEEIIESLPTFPSDAVAIRDLPGFDAAPHDVALDVYNYATQVTGISSLTRSLYFLRVVPGTFDTIRVRELRMIGAQSDSLLENEEWYEYDLPLLTFGNVNTLVILGAIPKKDGSFIVFTGSALGYQATCWNRNGVVWAAALPTCPNFGKYAPVDVPLDAPFYYISGSTVYRLAVDTGAVTTWTLTSTPPTLAGKQYYFSRRKVLFYESAGDKLAKIVLEQFTTNKETVGDAARDLTERLGLSPVDFDYTDIDTIEITGFRSGPNETAAAIMQSLGDVYQFTFAADDRIVFIDKSVNSGAVIADNDVIDESARRRTVVNKEDSSVRVTYFSEELFGEQAEQTFTLDLNAERVVIGDESSYSWPVLETDLFMRRLAERLATGTADTSSGTSKKIPPRYLFLTAGDTIIGDGRLRQMTIGADLAIEIEAVDDDPAKYGEVVPISAQTVISRRLSIDASAATLAAPIAMSTRPVFPASNGKSAGVYGGLANIDESFDAPTYMAPTNSLVDFVPSQPRLSATAPVAWGRLSQLPLTHPTAQFRTFPEDSVKIVFADQDMADRVLRKVSHYGKSPDRRTVDPFYNMLIVGREIMQYGYATGALGASREVTFTNLVRNGQNTDQFNGEHVLNEMCMAFDKDTAAYYEVAEGDIGETFKLFSYSFGPERRRFDTFVEEDCLLPIAPGYILRHDVATTSVGNPIQTRVHFRTRNGRWDGFRYDKADQGLTNFGMLASNSMYLLRADYDESLFEAERYGTSTAYIIKRYHGAIFSEFNASDPSQYYYFYGATPIYGGPTVLWDYLWDLTTEPLIVVFTSENDYGETRAVYKFPIGDYTDRPTRGLRVL